MMGSHMIRTLRLLQLQQLRDEWDCVFYTYEYVRNERETGWASQAEFAALQIRLQILGQQIIQLEQEYE